MKLDMTGVDMVREHKEKYQHIKTVEIIEKRKKRDRKFIKAEIALMCIGAVLLLNEDISWPQMMISGAFTVAALVADVVRRLG